MDSEPRNQSTSALDKSGAGLGLVAAVESRSEHSIARTIVEAPASEGIRLPAMENFVPVTGIGVRASVGNALRLRRFQPILAATSESAH